MNRWIKCGISIKGILFSIRKGWNTNIGYNMDQPWKHYAKLKKPVTKKHILGDSINMARAGTSGCIGLEMRLEWRITSIGHSFFGDDKNILNSYCSDSWTALWKY